jgi:endonuclease/exonuclease/phosphatase family metal-dependent hydrolase
MPFFQYLCFMKKAVFSLLAAVLLLVSAAGASAQSYRVLTYNVGLLRAFGSDLVPIVEARAAAAPAALAKLVSEDGPQVILLEEIWRDSYVKAIEATLAPLGYTGTMPNVHSIIGLSSGLLLLVHAPLSVVDWSFTPFTKTTLFDSFARKGVLQATLQDGGTGAKFALVGTHTVAVDTNNGVPKDKAQVAAVMAQIAMVRSALASKSGNGAVPALLLGDFNVGPGYVVDAYKAILGSGGLVEAAAASGAGPFTTWDPENPLVKYGGYPSEPAAQIDHIFLQDGGGTTWSVHGAQVVMTDTVPGLQFVPKKQGTAVPTPLSDHYAFLADVSLDH